MYLRHSTRRKDGKVHTYWRLVRSVRRGGKVVQETVAQLGELDAQGRARATALARSISGDGLALSQRELFDAGHESAPVAVKLDRVRLEHSRSFGAVWLGWMLWRALKLDALCGALMPRGREAVAWSEVVAILVTGGYVSPRASYTWRNAGIERRRWMTCWASPPRTSTTSGCIARSTDYCRTKRRWSSIW